MKLSQFKVLCDKCQQVEDVFVELEEVSNNEEEMGYEYQYEGSIDYTCSKCKNKISVNIEAWEYPEGVLNSGPDIEITGGQQKTTPNVTFEE